MSPAVQRPQRERPVTRLDADERARGRDRGRQRSPSGAGELVVLPTDTVYGIGADAFDPAAVRRC